MEELSTPVCESGFIGAAQLQTQACGAFMTTREAKSPRYVDSIQRCNLEPMNTSCQLENIATLVGIHFKPSIF